MIDLLHRVKDMGLAVSLATSLFMAKNVTAPEFPAAGANLSPGQQIDFVKWALEEGGLFVVIVLVLYFYRRDFRQSAANLQAQVDALMKVVQNNVTVMQAMKATNARLARAVEALASGRRPGRLEIDADEHDGVEG